MRHGWKLILINPIHNLLAMGVLAVIAVAALVAGPVLYIRRRRYARTRARTTPYFTGL